VNVVDQLESAPTFARDVYSVSLAEGNYTMVCELHTSSSPHNNRLNFTSVAMANPLALCT